MLGNQQHCGETYCKIEQSNEPLERRLVNRWREGKDGGKILCERRDTGSREKMPKELDLGNSKLTLWEENGEAVLPAQAEDLTKVVHVGGEIRMLSR